MNINIFVRKPFPIWMLAGLTCSIPCCLADDDDAEPEPVIINTQSNDDADSTLSGSARKQAEVEICSVLVRFIFQDNEGIEVQFENGNDSTVIVEVDNQTTGGLTVKNCLWPNGEDNEASVFGRGDRLLASVYLGEGDLLQYSCSELIGDAFSAFEFCDEVEIVIN